MINVKFETASHTVIQVQAKEQKNGVKDGVYSWSKGCSVSVDASP